MFYQKYAGFFSGNSRSVAIKKNILISLLMKGVSIMVSFVLVRLTIGYVSSELYGVWLTLSSIMTGLSFMDIGFSQGLKNKLTEAIANNEWERGKQLVSTTYFMMLLIFVPACIVLEMLLPYVNWCSLLNIDPVYESDLILAMQFLVLLACTQMIVNVFSSVVAAFQKVSLTDVFLLAGNILSLIVIIILIKFVTPSLVILTCSFALMPIMVTCVASLFFYFGKFRRVSPSIFYVRKCLVSELLGLGYKFFIINIQVLVLYQSTNVLISNVSSPLEVTNYNLAYKLLNFTMLGYTIITNPLWPAYTDAYTRGDYDWMRSIRKKMQKVLLLSVVASVLIVLASKTLYAIWVPEKADVPLMMTALVAVYVSAYCWMTLNGTLIVGMGKLYVETIMVVVGMLLHIPLSLFLGSIIGAYGVLISLIVINLFYAVLMDVQVRKLLDKTATGIWIK